MENLDLFDFTPSIDKDDYLDLLSTSDSIYWDEEKYSFDEFRKVLLKAINKTINEYTCDGGLEIDDWDMFDNDMVINANKLLGNDN